MVLINNNEYFEILEDIKNRIKQAQYKAVLSANKEQIELFWNIGKVIIVNTKYGNKFVENLARDIKADFPNLKGFSVRNLKYMRKFADFIGDFQIVQTVSALFSWSHNITLLDKTKTLAEYLWYADKIIEDGLSISRLEDKKAGRLSVLADNALSIYVFTIVIPCFSAYSLHSRNCPSIDCSFCFSEENRA